MASCATALFIVRSGLTIHERFLWISAPLIRVPSPVFSCMLDGILCRSGVMSCDANHIPNFLSSGLPQHEQELVSSLLNGSELESHNHSMSRISGYVRREGLAHSFEISWSFECVPVGHRSRAILKSGSAWSSCCWPGHDGSQRASCTEESDSNPIQYLYSQDDDV